MEYARELARYFPPQGAWTESEHRSLTDETKNRIEFVHGRVEFPAIATDAHEEILDILYEALKAFVNARQLGKVRFSGNRVHTAREKLRQPDVVFLGKEKFDKRHNQLWDGIDLAVEIVTDDPKDRKRDYEDKLVEYAEAEIAEYRIVDFQQRVVIVNHLPEGEQQYHEHGRFTDGHIATSVLLGDFSVDVRAGFAAADELAS